MRVSEEREGIRAGVQAGLQTGGCEDLLHSRARASSILIESYPAMGAGHRTFAVVRLSFKVRFWFSRAPFTSIWVVLANLLGGLVPRFPLGSSDKIRYHVC